MYSKHIKLHALTLLLTSLSGVMMYGCSTQPIEKQIIVTDASSVVIPMPQIQDNSSIANESRIVPIPQQSKAAYRVESGVIDNPFNGPLPFKELERPHLYQDREKYENQP